MKSTLTLILSLIASLCFSVASFGQMTDYYVKPYERRFAVFAGVTKNYNIESSNLNPVISLAYHFKCFEPEIAIRKEDSEQRGNYHFGGASYVPNVDYYKLIFKGYSLQASFPIAVTLKKFGVQIGPAIQIPFMRVTWREHSRGRTWPDFSEFDIMSWRAPQKVTLCWTVALRYNTKRYSLKVNAFRMLKENYLDADVFGDYVTPPINVSASLGYRF